MKKNVFAAALILNLGVFSQFLAAEMVKPTILQRTFPVLPDDCALQGQPDVIVEGLVTSSGIIIGVNAVKADDPELAEAAVNAVSQWRFAPATKDGAPFDAVVRIPVAFKSHVQD